MSSIVVSGDTSGAVTLSAPAVAGTVTVTLPSASGTMASLASVTNNGVAYVNSSGQTTTGSALVFDGTNLGVGVTPSAWGGSFKAIQIGLGTSLYNNAGANGTFLGSNFYWDGTNNKYLNTNTATAYGQSAGAHAWYTAASGTAGANISFTQAMTLDASGRLIVGSSTAPNNASGMLSVTLTNTPPAIALYQTGGASVGGAAITGSNSGLLMYTASGSWGSETYTERARIDTSGNLLVGTTGTALAKIDVRQATNATGLFIYKTDTGTASTLALRHDGASGATSRTQIEFGCGPSGTIVGTITSTGSATAYNTSSDYRLKHDIAPMTGALDKVAALKPVTYKWNVDGTEGQGFIAHELQAVVPDAVTGEKDAVETYTDEEGNEQTRPRYQGIDTSFLVATLTAAIQELKAELDTAKAQIAALQGAA